MSAANDKLAAANTQLKQVEEKVGALNEKVRQLEEQFNKVRSCVDRLSCKHRDKALPHVPLCMQTTSRCSTNDTTMSYMQASSEKNAASMELEACQRRLGLANRLITALASEGERWEATVLQLEKDYKVSAIFALP